MDQNDLTGRREKKRGNYFLWGYVLVSIVLQWNRALGQNDKTLTVADLSVNLKAKQEQVFYYGFADEDEILFSCTVQAGKELTELEIAEYPADSRLLKNKIKSLKEHKIKANHKAVYLFRLRNELNEEINCQLKIRRIPGKNKYKDFDTGVEWVTRNDTTWKIEYKDAVIGYDTTIVKEKKKEVVKTEIKEEILFDKTERVDYYWSSNGQKSYLKVNLPVESRQENKSSQVIAWAYWVGVGKEANDSYSKNIKIFGNTAAALAGKFLSPLAGYALGAITALALPEKGEDVKYHLVRDEKNLKLFTEGKPFKSFDEGRGVAAYGKNKDLLQGSFYICLMNDNYFTSIDVNVKVSALLEWKEYKEKEELVKKISPRTTKKEIRYPIVEVKKVPLPRGK